MLTLDDIFDYHAGPQIFDPTSKMGFELELFCIDKENYQRLVFSSDPNARSISTIIDYLLEHEYFTRSSASKTISLAKNNAKITFEPGGQMEYSSSIQVQIGDLLAEYDQYLKLLKRMEIALHIGFLDLSYYPVGRPQAVPLLDHPRYHIMDEYFSHSGAHGIDMMRFTTSLQMTCNYSSLADLEEKVNRILFVKPLFLYLTAHSPICNEELSLYHSYRTYVWQDVDPLRCGDPGVNFWKKGRWTVGDYIEKVLNAPVIFDVVNKMYVKSDGQPFRHYMEQVDREGYIFHNNTIFTDVRIKDYIEIRYCDNPGLDLVPGVMLLMSALLSNDRVWHVFRESNRYDFEDVPDLCRIVNSRFDPLAAKWHEHFRFVCEELIQCLYSECDSEMYSYVDAFKYFLPLKRYANNIKNSGGFFS